MLCLLANAQSSDSTDSNLTFVVITTLAIAGLCVLGAIPVVTARRRHLSQVEGIAAIMILWGLITAGSIIYVAHAQMAYTKEYMMRIMQNYAPPDQSDQPAYPWAIWGCLAAMYGGTVLFASTARTATARGFPVEMKPPTEEK